MGPVSSPRPDGSSLIWTHLERLARTKQIPTQKLKSPNAALRWPSTWTKPTPPLRGSIGEIICHVADSRRFLPGALMGLDALVRFGACYGDRTCVGVGTFSGQPG